MTVPLTIYSLTKERKITTDTNMSSTHHNIISKTSTTTLVTGKM